MTSGKPEKSEKIQRKMLKSFAFVAVTVALWLYWLMEEESQLHIEEKQMKPGGYKAVIVGSTGAVGGSLLRELLNSKKCTSITSIGRRKVDLEEKYGTCTSILI